MKQLKFCLLNNEITKPQYIKYNLSKKGQNKTIGQNSTLPHKGER
jgi:hypothetical protein